MYYTEKDVENVATVLKSEIKFDDHTCRRIATAAVKQLTELQDRYNALERENNKLDSYDEKLAVELAKALFVFPNTLLKIDKIRGAIKTAREISTPLKQKD